jgi:hypothetical protein
MPEQKSSYKSSVIGVSQNTDKVTGWLMYLFAAIVILQEPPA